MEFLQLLQGSHLDNFPLKTLKLDWVAFHSVTFHLKCSDFQSNQYKKLVPVFSRFCNGLLARFNKQFRVKECFKLLLAIKVNKTRR